MAYPHETARSHFLIGRKTAVEVKSSGKVSNRDLKGLKFLDEEDVFENLILVSQDRINSIDGRFQTLYWEKFLEDLWLDKFC